MFTNKIDKRNDFKKVDKIQGLVYKFDEASIQIVGEKKEKALILYNNEDGTYMYAPTILADDEDMVQDILDFFTDENNAGRCLTIKLYVKVSKKSGKDYFDYSIWA